MKYFLNMNNEDFDYIKSVGSTNNSIIDKENKELFVAIIEDMLNDCYNDLYEYEDIEEEKANLIYENVRLYTEKLKDKLEDAEYLENMKNNRLK